MSMADRDGKIWMDGMLVEWRDAKIHVLTHTLHYGMGVFEGIRAYETARGPAVFRLTDHIERLLDSAKLLMMEIPYSREELMNAQREVVRALLKHEIDAFAEGEHGEGQRQLSRASGT